MHLVLSKHEDLQERLQVHQSPPHERPQLVDQPPQFTLRIAMPRPLGVPTSFHPGSAAGRELQSSTAPQVVEHHLRVRDLLAGLVTGMRQLQDVLVKKEQASSSADEPETVKPGVSSIPKLKGIDPNTSPMDFQDWVTLLKARMHDMSATSHLWWPKVVHEAEQVYQRFATASPIEKLQVKPNMPAELTMGKWSRVKGSATSMLLAAFEDDLRTEMVNRRMCDSAVGTLYRLMTLYAAGGESEKTLALNKLQNPTRCTDTHGMGAMEESCSRVVDTRPIHFGEGCCQDHCNVPRQDRLGLRRYPVQNLVNSPE